MHRLLELPTFWWQEEEEEEEIRGMCVVCGAPIILYLLLMLFVMYIDSSFIVENSHLVKHLISFAAFFCCFCKLVEVRNISVFKQPATVPAAGPGTCKLHPPVPFAHLRLLTPCTSHAWGTCCPFSPTLLPVVPILQGGRPFLNETQKMKFSTFTTHICNQALTENTIVHGHMAA